MYLCVIKTCLVRNLYTKSFAYSAWVKHMLVYFISMPLYVVFLFVTKADRVN